MTEGAVVNFSGNKVVTKPFQGPFCVDYKDHILPADVLSPGISSVTDVLDKLVESMETSGRHETFYNLHDGRCPKYSRSTEEARMMDFIRLRTSIPTPKVYMVIKNDKGFYYIVVKFIKGSTLLDACLKGLLSSEDLQLIVQQLAGFVRQLRSIPMRHDGTFATLGGGPFTNVFFFQPCPWELRSKTLPRAPFLSLAEFHSYWLNRSSTAVPLPTSETYTPILTQGDLQMHHIMVSDGWIVAIIDWESLGWYPDCWKPMMIWRDAHAYDPWRREVEKIFPPTSVFQIYTDILFTIAKEPDRYEFILEDDD